MHSVILMTDQISSAGYCFSSKINNSPPRNVSIWFLQALDVLRTIKKEMFDVSIFGTSILNHQTRDLSYSRSTIATAYTMLQLPILINLSIEIIIHVEANLIFTSELH